MTQGAIFGLILRDDRFDNLITASDILRQRLDSIRVKNKAARVANVQPTFHDVERTHLLYIHATYKPYVSVASEYARVQASGDGAAGISSAGGTLQFTFPSYGHFTSDMVIHIQVDPIGTTATPTATTPYYRYCAYPGIRILKKVELRSQNVLIDDYTPDDVSSFAKFFVGADQQMGWDRCMGQQEKRDAAFYGNGFTTNFSYSDGPQTPKPYQPALDLYIPVQMWMCKDVSHALLNDLIPNSQRVLTCELASLQSILQCGIPSVANPGQFTPTTLPFSNLSIKAELYVNGLYVNPEIYDIFASRIGFSLIRVHRRQVSQLQTQSGQFLLDQLKYPAEFLMTGFRQRTLASNFDQWYLTGATTTRANANNLFVPAVIWNSALNVAQLVIRTGTDTSTLTNFVDKIGVSAHGIDIYPQSTAAFYNAYMPIRYSENSMVVSPKDTGSFMITFCLYPGKFNPSGYYNLSAGREMYLKYSLNADLDFKSGAYEMVISMSAINFLMRNGDKIALRYSV